jgi:hypothetical protein
VKKVIIVATVWRKSVREFDRVAAIYDWQDPIIIVGYYCPYHGEQGYDFGQKQKRDYENMTGSYKPEYIRNNLRHV